MELSDVSSEELSSYSFVHESPSNNGKKKHSRENDNFALTKKYFSKVNRLQPLRLNSLQKLRPESEPNSLKNKVLKTRESKSGSAKLNRKDCMKANIRVSSQKLKLINREFKRIGSLSTNSAVLRNPSSSKIKPCEFFSKKKENNLNSVPHSIEAETTIRGSKRKTSEVIEIEIFMPIIDSENNVIKYPKSKKPIVKIYSSEQSVPKSKDNIRKNNYSKKKNKESTKKLYLSSKTTKDQKKDLNKSISHAVRKGHETNAIKVATGKNKSPEKCSEHWNATGLEKHQLVAKCENLLKDVKSNTENVRVSNVEKISRHESFSHKNKHRYLKHVEEKLYEGNNKSFNSEHKPLDKAKKLPTDIASNFIEENDITLCLLKEDNGKLISQQGKKTKLIDSFRDPALKSEKTYKQLYLEKIALERKESNSSIHGPSTKIRSNENGWRTIPTGYYSNKNKWRRNMKDDGVSLECWIERQENRSDCLHG